MLSDVNYRTATTRKRIRQKVPNEGDTPEVYLNARDVKTIILIAANIAMPEDVKTIILIAANIAMPEGAVSRATSELFREEKL
ncbi:hypothetical protein LSH36_148g06027 [Paralvinella palmiformis]|uniref:Uncharacterized protein n=1 Tax=Paralvinella palmiformis TaxID=53620 RepID=A0AAD9JUZ8_9ANNE|nr:hypothetical protein LSH36_148g06027 [Paralvinella palmiformis]